VTLVASQLHAIRCGTEYPIASNCGAKNVTIDSCVVRGIGGAGIQVFGGTGWRTINNTVTSTGSTAVHLAGGNLTTLERADHVIANSTVSDFSRTCWTYQPGVNLAGVGVTATNNEIYGGPHQAVLWYGNDHLIQDNVIHSVVLETFDSAAIYSSDRDWTHRGTKMNRNLIFNVGRATAACNKRTFCDRHAIYLDALSMEFEVTNNIVVETAEQAKMGSRAILNNGGRDDTVNNNLCLGWSTCVQQSDCGLSWYAGSQSGKGAYATQLSTLKSKLASVVYRKRYPKMAALDDFISSPLLGNCSNKPSCAPGPWGNVMQTNAAVNASEPSVAFALPATAQFASSRFNASGNKGYNGSAHSLGFKSDSPLASNCWQLSPTAAGSTRLSARRTREHRRAGLARAVSVKHDDQQTAAPCPQARTV